MLGCAQITIIGKLGKDVESSSTPSGKDVYRISVAVTTGSGDRKHTDWYEVSAWYKVPDFIKQDLRKGADVMVSGDLTLVETEYNGKNYKKLTINAQRIIPLGSKAPAPQQQTLDYDGQITF